MAPLPCRTDSVRYNRETHSYLPASFDREQCLGGTGRDAGHILAEIARHSIRKNHRCPVLRMERNRPVRTDLGAVAALCASLQKQCLVGGTGRTQPIRPHRWWSRLFRHDFLLFGIFLCRFGNGNDRILEEVATSILRIGSHSDAPLHDAVSAQLVDLDAAIAGPEFDVPARVILADEIEYIGLELVAHILDP
jgi:hypothetical protein